MLEAEIRVQEEAIDSIDKFLATVSRYTTEIEKQTPAIVHEFIVKIIIYEPEQARGDRRQKVEIIYHRIGKIDPAEWQSAGAYSHEFTYGTRAELISKIYTRNEQFASLRTRRKRAGDVLKQPE